MEGCVLSEDIFFFVTGGQGERRETDEGGFVIHH